MKKSKVILSYIIVVMMTSCIFDFTANPKTNDDEQSIDLDDGLILHYTFEGNADDMSGNNHHGITYGNLELTSDKNGVENNAYVFDGVDDYINSSSTFDLKKRTLSVWLNPYSIEGAGGSSDNKKKHIAISQDDFKLKNGILRIEIDNGVLKLFAGGVSGTYSYDKVKNNTWYHIVLIRNNDETEYYLNGDLFFVGVADEQGSSFKPNKEFIVGAGRSKDNQFFIGKIDNIRLYNKVLTPEQITKLYKEYL